MNLYPFFLSFVSARINVHDIPIYIYIYVCMKEDATEDDEKIVFACIRISCSILFEFSMKL